MVQGERAARDGSVRRALAGWGLPVVGVVLTSLAVVVTRLVETPDVVAFWDNVHWTLAYGFASAIAFRSLASAPVTLRPARRAFSLAIGMLFLGQLLWDLQVALGWNPFPGPSDAFFLASGPCAILAIVLLCGGSERSRRTTILLDAAGIAFVVLALALTVYLPRGIHLSPFTLAVMVAYPTFLVGATALFLLRMLHEREALRLGSLLVALALVAQGLLWMEWNLATLEGRLAGGSLLNYLFSYATLLFGVGVARYEPSPVRVRGLGERLYRVTTQNLPLLFVLAAASAMALSTGLLPNVRLAIALSMAAVVVLAMVRQSLLLGDTERLLDAETHTRELSERLAHTQRLESLGTLASGIAHDMNNLLTAVLGHAELLREQVSEPEATHSVGQLRAAALRAREVVRQILAFSRREPSEAERVQVRSLLEEVVHLLRAALPAQHVLSVEVEGDPWVRIDPGQLHQVLMNLGTNASQAIGDGAGQVDFRARIAAGGETSGDGNVCITVRDTGAGMSEGTQKRIFEPFFTTKARGEGTGLGLSVAFGIIGEAGGRIEVTSQLGEGTCMKICLPSASPAEEVGQARSERSESGECLIGAAPGVESLEVLVVDDEALVAAVLVRFLLRAGQKPLVASASQAIDLVKADPQRFWLVITDMTMPEMSGADLGLALRQGGYGGRLVLSSGTDFVVSGTLFDDVLPKPYTLDALRRVLEQARAAPSKRAGDRSA